MPVNHQQTLKAFFLRQTSHGAHQRQIIRQRHRLPGKTAHIVAVQGIVVELRLLRQAAELPESVPRSPGNAHNPVIAAQNVLLLRSFLPIHRIGAGVAVNVFYAFCAPDESDFPFHPSIIGHHNVRLLRQADFQQSPALPAVRPGHRAFLYKIAQLPNRIEGWFPAVVVMNHRNSGIHEFCFPWAVGGLNKDGRLEPFLIQQANQVKQRLLRTAANQLIFYKYDLDFPHSGFPSRVQGRKTASGNRIWPQLA